MKKNNKNNNQRGTFGEDNYIWNYFQPLIDKEIEEGKIRRNFWSSFYLFQNMMKSGEPGTIQIGQKTESDN